MMDADSNLNNVICKEVIRLIKNQDKLICELLKIPDLLKEKITDSNTLKGWQTTLNDEAQKIEVIVERTPIISESALIIQSPTVKMLSYGKVMDNSLKLYSDILTESVEKINQRKKDFAQDIQNFEEAKVKFDKTLRELIDKFLKGATKEYNDTKQEFKNDLKFYFENKKHSGNNTEHKFKANWRAEILLAEFKKKICNINDENEKKLKSRLKDLSYRFEEQITRIITDAVEEILESERLPPQFNVPELDIKLMDTTGLPQLLRSSIKQSSETIPKTNSYYFVVDIADIEKNLLICLDDDIQNVSTSYQPLLEKELNIPLNNYFKDFKDNLERSRTERESLADREQENLKQQISKINNLKERAELHSQDVEIIKHNLK